MIPTLLTATIVFVIAFIAVPPVHLFFIAALGSTSGTSCASTRSAEFNHLLGRPDGRIYDRCNPSTLDGLRAGSSITAA